MNIYEKPMIIFESLEAKNIIAADEGALGELDPLPGQELSVPVSDKWFEYA